MHVLDKLDVIQDRVNAKTWERIMRHVDFDRDLKITYADFRALVRLCSHLSLSLSEI